MQFLTLRPTCQTTTMLPQKSLLHKRQKKPRERTRQRKKERTRERERVN